MLNSLVDKGIAGKFNLSRDVYFASPDEAVRQALVGRGEGATKTDPKALAYFDRLISVSRLARVTLADGVMTSHQHLPAPAREWVRGIET